MIDYIIGAIIGFTACIVLKPEGANEQEQRRIYNDRYMKHEEEIQYYKKLCKTLADENAEFRRRQ